MADRTRIRKVSREAGSFSFSKHVPILLLLMFLVFFAHLGSVPLFDPDEGAYSEVTREMLANQDFTSALLNGAPFFHKPPLFFWAQAASVKILGLNEFGLRLPSAVAALLWTFSIFLFTRRCSDTRTAWHATLFMGSSLLVTLVGRSATPEALLNLFLTLTLINIYRFHLSSSKRYLYWAFMFSALGVLTKGSVAMLLPASVSIVFFSVQRRWKDLLRLCNPVGIIVFGLIVIPWYLAEFMLYGEAFLSEMFLLQNGGTGNLRLLGSSLPYFAYPPLLFLGLLPNSALLVKAVIHIRKLLADDLMKFMFIWALVAFLLSPLVQPRSIFSLGYCTPPLFIIMAHSAESLRHCFNLFAWPLAFLVLLLIAPYSASYLSGALNNGFVRDALTEVTIYFDMSYQLTLGTLVLLLATLPFIRPVPAPVKQAVLGLLFVGTINFLVLPILGNLLQQPVKTAAMLARKEKPGVVTYRFHPPSFNVYAEMLTEEGIPGPGDIVLTRTMYLKELRPNETLYEKHGIVLAEILKGRQ